MDSVLDFEFCEPVSENEKLKDDVGVATDTVVFAVGVPDSVGRGVGLKLGVSVLIGSSEMEEEAPADSDSEIEEVSDMRRSQ